MEKREGARKRNKCLLFAFFTLRRTTSFFSFFSPSHHFILRIFSSSLSSFHSFWFWYGRLLLFNGPDFLVPHWSDLSVHSDSCAAEVELVTLIQEQTPLYKLRADPLTSFSGTKNIFQSLFVLLSCNFSSATRNLSLHSLSTYHHNPLSLTLLRMTCHFSIRKVTHRILHFLIHSTTLILIFLNIDISRHFSSTGYENNDWFISTPVLDPNEPIDLSPEFISETLSYFILSAERLSQMTKTYNDIEVVTRLLEEVSTLKYDHMLV